MNPFRIRCLAVTALLTLVTCGGGGGGASAPTAPPQAPVISTLSPTHGSPGTTVTLTGTGLSGTVAVSFNGHAAFSFAVAGTSEIEATVPATATSGVIEVTNPNGSATSALFTVDGYQVPTIASFTPSSLDYGGSVILITGNHFLGATRVVFNCGDAVSFTTVSDTLIQATTPTRPAAGVITVTTPGGDALSGPYSISWTAPTLTSVTPAQGPVGTPVLITGSCLGYPGTLVTLNGTSLALTSQSATQLGFTVPAGATTGSLVVSTPGGTVSRSFTVGEGVTLDLRVEKVQLTQSTQTLDNTVPIVAGKPGLIRVFALANQTNTVAPSVEITLRNNGVPVLGYPKTVAAPAGSVPMVLTEGSLSASWNLAVPGTDLTTPTGSGYSLTAVVDPAGTVAESDKTNNSITVPLSATTVPTFKTTIFPVVLSSGTGGIDATNKGAWVARLAKMYPIAGVDVQVGAAFTGSVSTLSSNDSDNSWDHLLNDLATKHQADGASDRYYYGALKVSYGSGVAGMGYVPGPADPFKWRTAIGWDKTSGYADGGLFPEVFAHETGHNMGREHSPCGGASAPDLSYPYAGGLIGVWGYDSTANQLMDPATCKDIMGYCTPNWVSDYVYKGILTFRAGSGSFLVVGAEDALPATGPSPSAECLLVRGFIHSDGKVDLLPSFRTLALPSSPPGQSDYSLDCLDAKGQPVFSTALELMDIGCSPQGHTRHFVMALPLEAGVLDRITGLRVLRAGQPVASLRSTSSASQVPAPVPVARRVTRDQVQLTWDAGSHPAALVRDVDSGEVIAILAGGHQTLTTRARQLDLVLSDGVAGPTHRLVAPD